MSKEKFKEFARNNPSLSETVLSGTISWQQLYELYEIYGEHSNIWNKYLKTSNQEENTTIKDIINTFKNLDMDSVQKGITNIEKTINLLQDIGLNKNKYEPKPIYKRF